jgi:uncharacterized RDD family membrane protein YckC
LTQAGPSGPRAGFGARLAGALIDALVVGLPLSLILFGLETNFLVRQAIGALAGFGYSVFFIGSGSGQTVGMKLINIRAVDVDTGGRVDYGRAVIRHLMSLVSGYACLIGYLWMLWDPERQTWHDKVANTYVVPTSAYPVDEWPG